MSYTLKINDKQAEIIQEALDLYARVLIGQLDAVVALQLRRNPGQLIETSHAIELLDHAKLWLFKDLSPTSSFSIEAEQAPTSAKTAYNILAAIKQASMYGTSVTNPNEYIEDVDHCLVTTEH